MDASKPPIWLSDFQRNLGSKLAQPLVVADGQLISDHYGNPGLRSYNTQFWLRIFQTLQLEFPTLVRLMGAWEFNQLIQKYVTSYPPHHSSLQRLGEKLPDFINEAHPEKTPRMLAMCEAARLDATYIQVFLAPAVPPWRFNACRDDLAHLQLIPGPHWAILKENFNLLSVLQKVPDAKFAAPLTEPRFTLVLREGTHICLIPLCAVRAVFFQRLCVEPLGSVTSYLAERFHSVNTAELEAVVQKSLVFSVEKAMWVEQKDELQTDKQDSISMDS